MLSILNDMFSTATRQTPSAPPRHVVDRHRAPVSDAQAREEERHRARQALDWTGLP